ncbi:MAG: ral secretion pathway protein [Proteobacteria bacterium]|nr:ral secretion pathway protein [Pseudomonadota bacterium]
MNCAGWWAMFRGQTKSLCRRTGFTLIELLVALALLSILSALTYRAVSGVLDAEKQVKETSRRWQDLAIFFDQLERDALQTIAKPIRDGQGAPQPEWSLRTAESAGDEALVEWTRLGDTGVRNSDSRRVGYRLKAGKLEYLQWPVLDRAPSTVATVIPIAEKIREMRWRCLTQDGRWLEFWPMAGMNDKLPRAVEVIVILDDGSSVTRLIPVGAT